MAGLSTILNGLTADRLSDPRVQEKINADVARYIWKDGYFDSWVGSAKNRAIKYHPTKSKDGIRELLVLPDTGQMIFGDSDIDTNLHQIEIVSQSIYPDIVATGYSGEVREYMPMGEAFDLKNKIEIGRDAMKRFTERMIFAALANNPTDCVCADATDGYKDTSGKTSVASCANEITKNDKLSVKTLRRAIQMAKRGQSYNQASSSELGRLPMKPCRCEKTTNGGESTSIEKFVICLGSSAAEQLRDDQEWRDMQMYAAPRGENNRIFTGLLGWIDGTPVIDMGVWSVVRAGMINSTVAESDFKNALTPNGVSYGEEVITPPAMFKGKDCEVEFGFLIGEQALIFAGASKPRILIDKDYDFGRKTRVGFDQLMTIVKTKFGKILSPDLAKFSGQDYGVITIFSPYV